MQVLLKQLQIKLLRYHQTKTRRHTTGCTKAAATAEVDSMNSSDCSDSNAPCSYKQKILMKIMYLIILIKLMNLTN